MAQGLLSYGTYLPYFRLQRSAIAAALGALAGKGARTVASFDEDTTSMGVEAGRVAMRSAPDDVRVGGLYFATAAPAYLDKTNATAVHAALGLPTEALTVDMLGAVRSGAGALLAARDAGSPTLAVLSDIRYGRPGSADETGGGDGAAAFLFGDGPVIAEVIAVASATEEFLDRWRLPEQPVSRVWEERFGERAYLPLAEASLASALKQADLTSSEVDHLIVTGVHPRAAARVVASAGIAAEAVADNLTLSLGNTGTAHLGLMLASVLDRAEPGQTIVATLLADGAVTVVLRTTDALSSYRRRATVADQVAQGRDLAYLSYLSWRGQLQKEPPRRPDPDAPAAAPALRAVEWKYGFQGSRDRSTGAVHLPPQRVSYQGRTVDEMDPVGMADVPGTIATYTVDHLAYSPSPPTVIAVVDFDGGGRFVGELTDVDAGTVDIGQRVEMTFRRLGTAQGIHNYFWKARPVRGEGNL